MNRPGVICRTVIAIGAVGVAAIGASPAVAHKPPGPTGSANVVSIHSTATELTATATAAPGFVEFRATTTDDSSGWIGLARLNEGVGWEAFLEILSKTVSDTPSEVIEGSAALAESATLLGGVVIHPHLPGAFTQRLTPGDYVLFDYRFLNNAQPRHRPLTVAGEPRRSPPGFAGALIARQVADAGPRLTLHGSLRAGQPFLTYNAMPDQIIEAVFFPIADDVTEAQLASWFAAFQDGDPTFPPDPPFDLSQGRGLLPLSPGRSAAVSVPLEPGRYVAVNWLKDAHTGTRLVKQGQYLVVQVS